MVLGLRYPRQHSLETFRGTQGNLNSSTGLASAGSGTVTWQNNAVILKAPARYSQVRKVVFSFATGILSGSATSAVVKLRISRASSTTPALNLLVTTVAPSGLIEGTSNHAVTPPGRILYAKAGEETTITQNLVTLGEKDRINLIQIEFDRFEADGAEFFADWDSVAGEDEYLAFYPVIEQVSANSALNHAFRFKSFECIVVQAPTLVNNSCLEWSSPGGVYDELLSAAGYAVTAYGPVIGATSQARRSWIYKAADFDAISGVHGVMFGFRGGGGVTTVTVGLRRLTSDSAVTTVTQEVFTFGGGGNWFLVRTADLKGLLVDGERYYIDCFFNGTPVGDEPVFSGYIEIIQAGFSKTVAKIQVGDIPVQPPNGVGVTDAGARLFDPVWFQGFAGTERVTRSLFISIILHQSASNGAGQYFRSDALLQSNDSLRASATAVDLMTHDVAGGIATGNRTKEEVPSASNDPINFFGQRRFQISLQSGDWTAGDDDQPGGMALYYALAVPNTEFPEIGEVFPIGAFNPEGCASTSAGLGDPGILVITNGSTIPKKFVPYSGLIEDAGVPTPFEDEIPSDTIDNSVSSPDTGLGIGIYKYRYTLRNCCTGKESDPNPDDITVDTTGASPAAQVNLQFAGVRIPGDEQICEICIYRTVLNADFPVMAKVGCLDVDDPTGIFTDDVSDDLLFPDPGTPGFADFEPLSLLNAPMPCVPVVVEFRNRLFAMGDIPQLSPAGTVSVENDSKYVTGDANVEWDRCLEGKFIQLEGDCRPYEIERVLPPEMGSSPPIARLKLIEPYEGTTRSGILYTICGHPNRLFISEPLEPECWPASNFIDIEPGDGDRLMGGASNFDRLVICKRRKTYVLSFSIQPATEVNVPSRISSDIGCIGPRSFAQVESGTVWLADRGLAIYDGRSVSHVEESSVMNDIFVDDENPRYIRRDENGRVIDAIGVFYPKREQYLLLLPTVRSDRGADLMLVWDIKNRNVTLLEFCQQFQSMVVSKDSDGNERVYLGDTNGFVWIYDVGDNDGAGFPNQTGTLRGTVSAAGFEDTSGAPFLDDSNASFVEGGLPELAGLSGIVGLSGAVSTGDLGLAGACVFTRAADAALDDPWTSRFIFAATPTRLYITPSWGDDLPAVGDDYMIGPISMEAVFKPNNYGTDDQLKRDWQQLVVHEPETVASQLRVELIPDFAEVDDEELTVVDQDDTVGKGRVFDMSFAKGRQLRPVGRRIYNFMQVKMSNFAPDEPVRILNHILRSRPRS